MDIVCVSASNMASSGKKSVSLRLCGLIAEYAGEKSLSCETLDLRDYELSPCNGCGGCYATGRCARDKAFNEVYEKLLQTKHLFIVSPHYAPIPAKLSMLLEKLEQLAFLHWWRDESYKARLSGLPTGIISHGGGGDFALASYRAMVNDTIANALATAQLRVVPCGEYKNGLALCVRQVSDRGGYFPAQDYDWEAIKKSLRAYAESVIG